MESPLLGNKMFFKPVALQFMEHSPPLLNHYYFPIEGKPGDKKELSLYKQTGEKYTFRNRIVDDSYLNNKVYLA